MKTNVEIVKAFMNHQEASNRSMWSDGMRLFSYQTIIAQWTNISDRTGIVANLNRYSQTTTQKHQAPLRYALQGLAENGARVVIVDSRIKQNYVSDGVIHLNDYIPMRADSLLDYAYSGYDFMMYNLKGGV